MIDGKDFKKWLEVFNVPSGGGGGAGVTKEEVQQFAFNYSDSGGVNDAFVVTLDPPVMTLTDNLFISMSSGTLENTTESPTLQVDSLPAKPIKIWSGQPAPGDISTDSSYIFIYNQPGDFFELFNPSISAPNSFLVQDNFYNSAIDTGVADAYEVTLPIDPDGSFGIGFPVYMRVGAGNDNTGASTLTVNGVTAPITLTDGSALQAGALFGNQIAYFIYDSANWVLTNPSVSVTITGTQTITGAKTFDDLVLGGAMNAGSNLINNVTDPSSAQDAATKNYVDTAKKSLQSVQVFTAGGTWNKPAGINLVRVEVVGGGGGGGGCNATGVSGVNEAGGGGAGGAAIEIIDVSGTSSETVTVGAAGSGGAAGTNAGSSGGTSSFGAFCSATGGSGGDGGAATTSGTFSNGGNGGAGTGGSYNLDGGDGCNGLCRSGATLGQGHGAASFYGGQAKMISISGFTNAGKLYGGGGAGVLLGNSQSAAAGSDGAGGIVVVYEYS